MTIKNENGNFIGPPSLGETSYEFDHFSGSQVNIMIGDVLIDTVSNIAFSVAQQKTPIYGYAHQYYSFLAAGKVIVQGHLVITFKEAGYLFWPMERFLARKATPEKESMIMSTSPRYHTAKDGSMIRGFETESTELNTYSEYGRSAKGARTMRANVEQMMEWANKPQDARSQYNRFVKDLGSLSDEKFEDWAETFQDAVWYGTDTDKTITREMMNSKNLTLNDFVNRDPSSAELDNVILSHRRADQYPEIDIWITYGNTNKRSANHTVKKLLDVSFTNCQQQIGTTGEPVAEVYSFIAKNIV